MPSVEELQSIVDETRTYPSIDPVFQAESDNYWTSSPLAGEPGHAWKVQFDNGAVNWDGVGGPYYVRAVRCGP